MLFDSTCAMMLLLIEDTLPTNEHPHFRVVLFSINKRDYQALSLSFSTHLLYHHTKGKTTVENANETCNAVCHVKRHIKNGKQNTKINVINI